MIKEKIWIKAARNDSWIEQKRRCKYCYTPLLKSEVTADHVKPKSKGGVNRRENIVASCRHCNRIKDSMSEAKFLKLIKQKPNSEIPWPIQLIWMRRKIFIQTDRSCKKILNMVGME